MRKLAMTFLLLASCAGDSPGSGDSGSGNDSGSDSDAGVNTDAGADVGSTMDTGADTTTCGDTTNDANNCGACGHVCNSQSCLAGECSYHTVFVTSLSFYGNIGNGGIADADQECQMLATAAGLQGKYMAWLSVGVVSPSTRFFKANNPYKLTDGTSIANDWTALTSGALLAGISADEKMGTSGNSAVWTNTKSDGTMKDNANDCGGFTGQVGMAIIGFRLSVTGTWTDGGPQMCSLSARLYCFEQ